MTVPADIGNRALDAAGWPGPMIGDLEEGTEQATPVLRAYGPGLRQLLRTAHWDFARKMAPMTLLADATGQTSTVGTQVADPQFVYEYALPTDCVKARIVPWNNINSPGTPQFSGSFPIVQGPAPPGAVSMTGLQSPTSPPFIRLIPARFLVTLDYNYPALVGSITDWSQLPDIQTVEGQGPQQRTVILTNVQNASLVYTALVLYPDEWDPLFQEAFVQLLAARIALPLAKDKRLGLALQAQAIAACKMAIADARVVNGNESGFPQTTDHTPDFIRTRWSQWGMWGNAAGPGVLWGGWDQMGFGDGSVF